MAKIENENVKITISKKDFMELTFDVIVGMIKDIKEPMIMLLAPVIVAPLTTALFDKPNKFQHTETEKGETKHE